jgi:hypothetical protein
MAVWGPGVELGMEQKRMKKPWRVMGPFKCLW